MPASQRKTPRQDRSRRTVERILDAAARIFHEEGHAGATTNAIADEANVSVGSLYQYFPNKDALLLALAHRHIESTTSGLAALLDAFDPDVPIDGILRSVLDFLVEQHDLDELHLLVVHRAPRTPELAAELDRARSRLVDVTSSLLARRIDDPERRELIAGMVVATIDAAVHDVILRRPRGPGRDDAVELTIATALGIIESTSPRRGIST